jgi:flagellar secretion chaperone FliS
MTKDLIQSYATRVTQASKSELIVIMYEVILSDIDSAKTAFELNDIDTYTKDLKHAGRFLNELMGSLDYRYEISYELMSLYIYINKVIIKAIYKKDPEILQSAESVLLKLKVGFDGVSKVDNSGPVMQNTQQVYAGLTYGKGTLNEVTFDPNASNRGFKA